MPCKYDHFALAKVYNNGGTAAVREYMEKIYGNKALTRNVIQTLKKSKQVHYDREKDKFDIQDDSVFIDLDTLCGDESDVEPMIQPAVPYESQCKNETSEMAHKRPEKPSEEPKQSVTSPQSPKASTEDVTASDSLLYQKLVEERLKLMLKYVDVDIFSKKIRILSQRIQEDGFNVIMDS
jgi:hypothetical protein